MMAPTDPRAHQPNQQVMGLQSRVEWLERELEQLREQFEQLKREIRGNG